MANATKIIKDWCASCGMPEPSDGECHALTVALAATPAAAAPVVLPEPFALYDGEKWYANEEAAICSCANMQKLQKVYIEQQVRALLAEVSAPAAQAVPEFCHVAQRKLKSLLERGYTVTGYALEKPVGGAQPDRGFINHGGFVGWWWDGQTPQAQADARDAESEYQRGYRHGYNRRDAEVQGALL